MRYVIQVARQNFPNTLAQSRVLVAFEREREKKLARDRERQRGESACFCEEENRKWRLFSGSWEMALH